MGGELQDVAHLDVALQDAAILVCNPSKRRGVFSLRSYSPTDC